MNLNKHRNLKSNAQLYAQKNPFLNLFDPDLLNVRRRGVFFADRLRRIDDDRRRRGIAIGGGRTLVQPIAQVRANRRHVML